MCRLKNLAALKGRAIQIMKSHSSRLNVVVASPCHSSPRSHHSMSSDEAQNFIDEVWGLQGVAYLVLLLRYYSRIVTLGWGKLALDDFLIALATVCCTCEGILGLSLS